MANSLNIILPVITYTYKLGLKKPRIKLENNLVLILQNEVEQNNRIQENINTISTLRPTKQEFSSYRKNIVNSEIIKPNKHNSKYII